MIEMLRDRVKGVVMFLDFTQLRNIAYSQSGRRPWQSFGLSDASCWSDCRSSNGRISASIFLFVLKTVVHRPRRRFTMTPVLVSRYPAHLRFASKTGRQIPPQSSLSENVVSPPGRCA